MAGRVSVWSDEVNQELAAQFVPATDESYRLQTSDDPQARFFRSMVHGRPDPVGGSRQGTYLCTPGGKLLARANSTNPRRIEALLREGLAAWDALTPAERAAPAPEDARPGHRWEDSFPADGLALTAVHRDLTRDASGALCAEGGRWNLDHVWFSRDEARAWLPAEPAPGARHELPAALAQRWARFHLVDNVRGQEGPFAPGDVKQADVATTVVAVDGARVTLDIHGQTRAVSTGEWSLGSNLWEKFPNRPRTLEARLAGRAVFDLDARRFVAFELVALGTSWGGSGLNGRKASPDASHELGWRFSLAGDTPADRVAPAFIDIYEARWVRGVGAD